MAESYHIDAEHHLVSTVMSGVLTERELRDHYERLRADPQFKSNFHQLCDLREVVGVDASTSALISVAQDYTFAPEARRAIVASTPVVFGLARLFAAHAERKGAGGEVSVFDDVNDAAQWLGLPKSMQLALDGKSG